VVQNGGVELSDGVVTVRPFRDDDAPAVHEACQDAEIQRRLPQIPQPYTEEHALAYVRGEATGGAIE